MPQRERGRRGEGGVVHVTDPKTGESRYRIKIPTWDAFDRPAKPITKLMPRGTTEAQARREWRRMLAERDAGRLRHTQHETVESLLTRWLVGLTATGAQNTSTTYRRMVTRYIAPALGHLTLAKLEQRHVRALLEQIVRDGKQPTAATVQSTLIRALDFAMHEEILTDNVARRVKLGIIVQASGAAPHRPRTKRVPSAEHVAALLHRLEPHPYGLVVAILATHGLRLAESLGMAFPKVDRGTGIYIVDQNLTHRDGRFQLGPTKTGRPRPIVLDDEIVERLAQWEGTTSSGRLERGRGAWLQAQPEFHLRPGFENLSSDLMFTQPDGWPFLPTSIRYMMASACAALEIPIIQPHELRHFVDTELDKARVDPATRRGILGHESAEMDAVYVHTDIERLREATAVMAKRLRR